MSKLRLILQIVLGVLFLVAVVFILIFVGDMEAKAGQLLGLGAAYLGIAAVSVLIFSIMNAATNLSTIINALISILFLAIVGGIAYFLASDQEMPKLVEQGLDVGANVYKLSGTGLIATYILLGLAVLSIVVSEVLKIFR
jgi:flagellar basal body-associated protein FliL